MWQAEADTELSLSASPTTTEWAKRRYSTVYDCLVKSSDQIMNIAKSDYAMDMTPLSRESKSFSPFAPPFELSSLWLPW